MTSFCILLLVLLYSSHYSAVLRCDPGYFMCSEVRSIGRNKDRYASCMDGPNCTGNISYSVRCGTIQNPSSALLVTYCDCIRFCPGLISRGQNHCTTLIPGSDCGPCDLSEESTCKGLSTLYWAEDRPPPPPSLAPTRAPLYPPTTRTPTGQPTTRRSSDNWSANNGYVMKIPLHIVFLIVVLVLYIVF